MKIFIMRQDLDGLKIKRPGGTAQALYINHHIKLSATKPAIVTAAIVTGSAIKNKGITFPSI
jgi:hypothetical protein